MHIPDAVGGPAGAPIVLPDLTAQHDVCAIQAPKGAGKSKAIRAAAPQVRIGGPAVTPAGARTAQATEASR